MYFEKDKAPYCEKDFIELFDMRCYGCDKSLVGFVLQFHIEIAVFHEREKRRKGSTWKCLDAIGIESASYAPLVSSQLIRTRVM